jgi:hypothetical protein
MNKEIEDIAIALEAFASVVLNGLAVDTTLTEQFGWNCPALTRFDLAAYPEQLAKRLRELNTENLDIELLNSISSITKKLSVIQAQIVPQLYVASSCSVASVVYISSMDAIANSLMPITAWQTLADPKSMPAGIARRIKALNLQTDDIVIDKNELLTKLKLINDTHVAAENLPINLEDLTKAQARINKANEDAATILGKIEEKNAASDTELEELTNRNNEAKKLIELCEEAYQITTTKGLAAAFELRAQKLSRSMSFWVVGLMFALGIGVFLASTTFSTMLKELENPTPNMSLITVNIIIAILSVGAPAWFSWLATKQIGQKFRLSEDYAYKASVAKAYEGYRKEAVRIDPQFETRLFSSALTRLEEAPLRLIEKDSHGSPIHELIGSAAFKNTLDKFPDINHMFKEFTQKIANIGNNPELKASVPSPSIEQSLEPKP